MRQAAATAALDDVHVRAQGLERARGRVAGAREEVVDDARGEEADADDGPDFQIDSPPPEPDPGLRERPEN